MITGPNEKPKKQVFTKEDIESLHTELGDIALQYECGKLLVRHYPGYEWAVKIDARPTGGVMYIKNETINNLIYGNQDYGMTLYLNRVYQDPDRKCVIMAGGEILERARLARGEMKHGNAVLKIDGVEDRHQPINNPFGNIIV